MIHWPKPERKYFLAGEKPVSIPNAHRSPLSTRENCHSAPFNCRRLIDTRARAKSCAHARKSCAMIMQLSMQEKEPSQRAASMFKRCQRRCESAHQMRSFASDRERSLISAALPLHRSLEKCPNRAFGTAQKRTMAATKGKSLCYIAINNDVENGNNS